MIGYMIVGIGIGYCLGSYATYRFICHRAWKNPFKQQDKMLKNFVIRVIALPFALLGWVIALPFALLGCVIDAVDKFFMKNRKKRTDKEFRDLDV